MAAVHGVLFGLLAMFGYGLSNALAKIPSQAIGSKKTILYRNIFVSAILLVALLVFLKESVFNLNYILITLAISLIGYIPVVSFYKALSLGKLGVISPIANSSVLFTVLFSFLFFKEKLSLIQLLAILVITAGIVFSSLNFKEFKSSRLFKISSGVPFALISCFLWGLVFTLFKIPVNVLGPVLTSFVLEFGMIFYSTFHLKLYRVSFKAPPKRIMAYLFGVALFAAMGTLCFNLGITKAQVSLVAAFTFANPLVAVLYGKLVYKEKLKKQQWLAIGLILAGIVSLAYF